MPFAEITISSCYIDFADLPTGKGRDIRLEEGLWWFEWHTDANEYKPLLLLAESPNTVLVELIYHNSTSPQTYWLLIHRDFWEANEIIQFNGNEHHDGCSEIIGRIVHQIDRANYRNIIAFEFVQLTQRIDPRYISFIALKAWIFRVFSLIMDVYESTKKMRYGTSSKEAFKIIQLESKLSANLSNNLPEIRQMAESVNMSSSKFKSLFMGLFGESPHRYFTNKKLLLAQQLILDNEKTIAEIAYRLGFNDPSGLTKLFKRELGVTPADYREKIRS